MANFYAKIKQMIKDCDSSYIEPLSYIKHFSTQEHSNASSHPDKIILLYKRVSKIFQHRKIIYHFIKDRKKLFHCL